MGDADWNAKGRELVGAARFFGRHASRAPLRLLGWGKGLEDWRGLFLPLAWATGLFGPTAAEGALQWTRWWTWEPALLWGIGAALFLTAFLKGVWEELRGIETERDRAISTNTRTLREILEARRRGPHVVVSALKLHVVEAAHNLFAEVTVGARNPSARPAELMFYIKAPGGRWLFAECKESDDIPWHGQVRRRIEPGGMMCVLLRTNSLGGVTAKELRDDATLLASDVLHDPRKSVEVAFGHEAELPR